MLERLRILPVTIVAASALLTVKVTDLMRAGDGTAIAAQPASAEVQTADARAAQTSAPAETDPNADESEAGAESDDAGLMLANRDPATFTQSELALLANLAKRRDGLEKRARELTMRENLLQVTEERIDGKINELRSIEERIQGLIEKYDDEEKAQLRRLVKVYENMKPKDAARIFDRLEMEILINVARRMKEAKMAAVLAKMKATRAEELTVELATRGQFPELDTALN